MALEIANVTRKFVIDNGSGKKETIEDPNIELSPEEVLKFYASSRPELTNAKVEGPKMDGDKAVYSITTKVGKLG